MSGTDVPELRFGLIGDWQPVLSQDPDEDLVREYIAQTIGRRDVDATIRARLRRDLDSVVDKARAGGAHALFIATRLQKDIPMAATLTVYAPQDLHMSPAVGHAPERVMDVLITSLTTLEHPHLDSAARISLPQSEVLRIHHVDESRFDEVEGLVVHNLVVDYWYTVPGSKQVVIANFSTPLGAIANVMLDFFDGLVRASSFDVPADASVASQGRAAR